MNFTSRLAKVLNLQPGEGHLVALMIVYSTFIGIAIDYFFIASNATFLEQFDAELFPFVIFASGFALIFTKTMYTWVENRTTSSRLLVITLVVLIVLTMIIRGVLQFLDARWFVFSLLILFPVVNRLIFWGYWGLANRLFNIGQSKRLFSLIAGGLVIASISGAFTVPIITGIFGTTNMYLVSALAMIGCLAIVLHIQRQYRVKLLASETGLIDPSILHGDTITRRQQANTQNGNKERIPRLWQNRYVVLLLLLFVVTLSSNKLIDFALLDRLQTQFDGDGTQIASFMGVAFGVTAFFQFLFRFLLAGRIMTRYGMRLGLLTLPVVFTINNLITLIIGLTVGTEVALFFWMVIFTKYSEETLREGINDSAKNILYQPIPAKQRQRVLIVVEGYGSPIAMILSGLLLIFFAVTGSFTPLTGPELMLVFGFIWIVLAVMTYRAYIQTLKQSVEQRTYRSEGIGLDDAATVAFLEEKLLSPHAAEAVYALTMLEEHHTDKIVANLDLLLRHKSQIVRKESLLRIEKYRPEVDPAILQALIRWEKTPEVIEYGLRALISIDEEGGFDRLNTMLQSDDMNIRRGAMVGLLRSGGIEGVLAAGQELLRLNASKHFRDRMFGAQVLGQVGIRNFYQPLVPLLQDPHKDVRRAALEAAANIKHPGLWQYIIDELGTTGLHGEARNALAVCGADVLPIIQQHLHDNENELIASQLIRVVGRIGTEEAHDILKPFMYSQQVRLRADALRALNSSGYRIDSKARLEEFIEIEGQEITWILATILAFVADDNDADVQLLVQSFADEIRYAQERIFFLLSMAYNSQLVLSAYHTFVTGNETQRAYSLEVIDNLLPPDMKRIIIPALEDMPYQTKFSRLNAMYSQSIPGRNKRLLELIDDTVEGGEIITPKWIRAVAIYTVGRMHLKQARDLVAYGISDPDPSVREISAMVLYALDTDIPIASKIINQGKMMLSIIEKLIMLQTVPLFANTPNDVLARVAHTLHELSAEANERIITKGELGTSMYIIVRGQVRVHDEDRTLNHLKENDVFGEMALLDPEPRTASVTATEPTTLFQLNQNDFYELMADHPEIMRGIITVLTANLRARAQDVLQLRRELEDLKKE